MAKTEKTIDTLVEDIYALLEGDPKDFKVPDKLMKQYSKMRYEAMKRRFSAEEEVRDRKTLRISNIGKPCERSVWYSIHRSEDAIPFRGWEQMKFLYGDDVEDLVLFLAEAAGHSVTGCQDKLEVEGVVGHRDCVIDGMLVDVKSSSQYGMEKFREGLTLDKDDFGYIGQLQTYLEASQDDPLVTIKDKCAFLVVDKSLGHIVLDVHDRMDVDIKALTRRKVEVMASETEPPRRYAPEDDGYYKGRGPQREFVPNGNKKLPFQCGYCSFRNICWPDHRVFLGRKPLYLTEVKREPRMVEVDFDGNLLSEPTD